MMEVEWGLPMSIGSSNGWKMETGADPERVDRVASHPPPPSSNNYLRILKY